MERERQATREKRFGEKDKREGEGRTEWRRFIITIIIYPLTARVVGAPQMISQPVSSIFPCSPLPFGTW